MKKYCDFILQILVKVTITCNFQQFYVILHQNKENATVIKGFSIQIDRNATNMPDMMVSLCSGARKAMKSLFHFCWTPKPMNTTRKWSSFVKSHYTTRVLIHQIGFLGWDIVLNVKKYIQVEYPSGSGPLATVFSTKMDSTWSQLNVASGFLENDLWKVKWQAF